MPILNSLSSLKTKIIQTRLGKKHNEVVFLIENVYFSQLYTFEKTL